MPPRRITLIRAALPVKCPSCGAEISWEDAGGPQFLCPECGHGVRVRTGYFRYGAARAEDIHEDSDTRQDGRTQKTDLDSASRTESEPHSALFDVVPEH